MNTSDGLDSRADSNFHNRISTMDATFKKQFLTDTDDTGRFVVTSTRTGKTYYVEPIVGKNKVKWGDLNPATGKIEGDYGKKYRGAVDKDESLVTEENGFSKVHTLDPGTSPLHAIQVIDADYPDVA